MKNINRILLYAVLLLIAGCAFKTDSNNTTPDNKRIYSEIYGIYNWNPDYTKAENISDRLNWGSDIVASYGTRTIRVELGYSECASYGFKTEFTPDFRTDADYLKRKAASEQYRKLFNDTRFSTYLLTVYSFQGYFRCWAVKGNSHQCNAPLKSEANNYYTPSEAEFEKKQIQNLSEFLVKTFPDKTFIIFNWEGDNDIDAAKLSKFGGTSANERLNDYQSFIQARADGVAVTRKIFPNSRIYSGFEVNCVRNDCIGGGQITDQILSGLTVDYLSYSAWTTIAPQPNDTANSISDRLVNDFNHILTKSNSKRPGTFTTKNLILGEFGYDRFQWKDKLPAQQFFKGVTDAVEKLQLPFAIYWQIIDNPDPSICGGSDPTRYGLKDKFLNNTVNSKILFEVINQKGT